MRFTFIDQFFGGLYKRLKRNTETSVMELALFRIFYGIFFLAYFAPRWVWLGDMPSAFYAPKYFSFASLFNDFPGSVFFLTLELLLLLLFLAITIGFYTRMAFFATFIITSIAYSFQYSFGKIDHGSTWFIFSSLILAFTNGGTELAVIRDKKWKEGWGSFIIIVFALMICFGNFTAGFAKLRWVDFDSGTSGFLDWFYKGYIGQGRTYLISDIAFHLPNWLIEISDHLVPFLEIGAFAFLFMSKKWWKIYLILMSSFHLGVLLVLNIPFTMNISAYGIFILAPVFYAGYKRIRPNDKSLLVLATVIVSALLGAQLYRRYLLYSDQLQLQQFENAYLFELQIGAVLWIATIVLGIWGLFLTDNRKEARF